MTTSYNNATVTGKQVIDNICLDPHNDATCAHNMTFTSVTSQTDLPDYVYAVVGLAPGPTAYPSSWKNSNLQNNFLYQLSGGNKNPYIPGFEVNYNPTGENYITFGKMYVTK